MNVRFGAKTTEGRAILDTDRPHVAIGYLTSDDELYGYDADHYGVLIGANVTDKEALAIIKDWLANGRT